MKTKDRLKEEIGFDKLLMTIASAMCSSLVSWLFNNREQDLSIIIFVIFLIAVFFFLGTAYSFFNIINKIRKLDYDH